MDRLDTSDPAAPVRVLLIEGRPDTRESFRMLLQLWGYEVAAAPDGRRGIGRARELRPAVVLVGFGGHSVDGCDVGRAVRSALGDEVLLVALDPWDEPEDCRRTEEAGFDAHLCTPCEPAELQQLLRQRGRGPVVADQPLYLFP